MKSWKVFNDKLVGVHRHKTAVVLNKPIYVGAAILDLSKLLMYDFHYNTMKKKYGKNIKLLGTDTDSLKYVIETEDLYQDMKEMSDHFDFSEYGVNHFCYDKTNAKVLGKFKDETNGNPIIEFVGLRPKMYSQKVYNINDKTFDAKRKAKGVKKSSVEDQLPHEEFIKALQTNTKKFAKMTTLRSFSHQIYSIELNKVGLCSFDDKVYVLSDGINTYNYGHHRIDLINKFNEADRLFKEFESKLKLIQ